MKVTTIKFRIASFYNYYQKTLTHSVGSEIWLSAAYIWDVESVIGLDLVDIQILTGYNLQVSFYLLYSTFVKVNMIGNAIVQSLQISWRR